MVEYFLMLLFFISWIIIMPAVVTMVEIRKLRRNKKRIWWFTAGACIMVLVIMGFSVYAVPLFKDLPAAIRGGTESVSGKVTFSREEPYINGIKLWTPVIDTLDRGYEYNVHYLHYSRFVIKGEPSERSPLREFNNQSDHNIAIAVLAFLIFSTVLLAIAILRFSEKSSNFWDAIRIEIERKKY